jgi:hypothetical protein
MENTPLQMLADAHHVPPARIHRRRAARLHASLVLPVRMLEQLLARVLTVLLVNTQMPALAGAPRAPLVNTPQLGLACARRALLASGLVLAMARATIATQDITPTPAPEAAHTALRARIRRPLVQECVLHVLRVHTQV